jgi:hypothetical protein
LRSAHRRSKETSEAFVGVSALLFAASPPLPVRRDCRNLIDMQRATKIFQLEERQADSPFIDAVWRTTSAPHNPLFQSLQLIGRWSSGGKPARRM